MQRLDCLNRSLVAVVGVCSWKDSDCNCVLLLSATELQCVLDAWTNKEKEKWNAGCGAQNN